MEHQLRIAGSHALPQGQRVRLRLAQARDVPAIEELLRAQGTEREPLEVARLIRIDPRRRIVICATGLVDRVETLLGVAAMDVEATEPDLLCVDRTVSEGLTELLRAALASRAQAIVSRRAA
jgi:uncharacterized protein (DUF58 family)